VVLRSTTGLDGQINPFGDFCAILAVKPANLPMISGPFGVRSDLSETKSQNENDLRIGFGEGDSY
jgi:hypothetical protein